MERIRVAGIILIEDGFALIHRKNVQNRDLEEYYVFPGGGKEPEESSEEGTKREIKEELGIKVNIVRKLYELESEKFQQKEIFYLCEYVSGTFGTGDGPEFSNDPNYKESGDYFPEIIKRTEIENIPLMPPEIKKKLLEDMKQGKI